MSGLGLGASLEQFAFQDLLSLFFFGGGRGGGWLFGHLGGCRCDFVKGGASALSALQARRDISPVLGAGFRRLGLLASLLRAVLRLFVKRL